MMAQFTYQCTGAEDQVSGRTVIDAYPSSGAKITNLFVGGVGQLIEADYVLETTGHLLIAGPLQKGTWVKILYKNLPRWQPPEPEPPPATGNFKKGPGNFKAGQFK